MKVTVRNPADTDKKKRNPIAGRAESPKSFLAGKPKKVDKKGSSDSTAASAPAVEEIPTAEVVADTVVDLQPDTALEPESSVEVVADEKPSMLKQGITLQSLKREDMSSAESGEDDDAIEEFIAQRVTDSGKLSTTFVIGSIAACAVMFAVGFFGCDIFLNVLNSVVGGW